ncbi:MAG: glycosyltransferase, partial [Acidimicrobiia bacterium]
MNSEPLPSPPRAMLVASSNRRRGAEVFSERLAVGLSEHGWVVDLISLTGTRESARARIEPITDMAPSSASGFKRRIAGALRHRIRDFDPDVLVANGGATLRYCVVSTLRTSTPILYIAIGEPIYWIRSWMSKTLNRLLLRRVRLIVAVSQQTADQLSQLEPHVRDRIEVVVPGVSAVDCQGLGEEHEGPLRLLQIGSLSREKDPAMAISAIEQLPDVLLRFVGSGPLREDLVGRVRAAGLVDRVEFVGAVDDVTPHLVWADALLLTSRTEGLPGVILEAAAVAVPTVAVDVGGVSEAVVSGLTGVVVERETR